VLKAVAEFGIAIAFLEFVFGFSEYSDPICNPVEGTMLS
jgi:hypothetical protein